LTSKQGRTYQEDDRESNNEGEEEQGFEFRLFSSAPNKPAGKIVLKPEEDEDGDGNFVRRERDKSYYFAPPASGERKAGIESMAISGETVLLWRKIRAKGLEVPWRVKTIRVPSSSNPTPTGSSLKSEAIVVDEGETRKKCKPNKKRRLILREKQRKKEKAEEEKRKRDQGREEAEREKKTRKNREKKVKRKLKEKLKKASGTVESRTVGNGNDRDDDDDADVDMENGEE